MSSPESKTCPSVVTTSRGIGGAWRNISVPTQPSTPKEHTKMAMNISQSFFITSHSSRIGLVGKTCRDHTRRAKYVPVQNPQFNYRFSVAIAENHRQVRRISH